MALTIKQYTKTCDTCQKTRIPTKGSSFPLYPHKIATRPFQTYHVDFKNLTRRTDAGNTCILVIVCEFSGLSFLIPAKESTSLTTAKLIVRDRGALLNPYFHYFWQGTKFCLPPIWIYSQDIGHSSCDVRRCVPTIQRSSRRSREEAVGRVKTFRNA